MGCFFYGLNAENVVPFDMDLPEISRRLNQFQPIKPHDAVSVMAIQEAIGAIEKGGWGIGAVLIDNQSGVIIGRGQNKTTRSDWHAEMDLLNQFEDEHQDKKARKALLAHCTLVTSLEPCPMCLCRMIAAGVGTVYYVAPDVPGGMVHLLDRLPETWQELAKGKIYAPADCSAELVTIAGAVFQLALSDQRKQAYIK